MRKLRRHEVISKVHVPHSFWQGLGSGGAGGGENNLIILYFILLREKLVLSRSIHILKKNSSYSNSSDLSNQELGFVNNENTSWDPKDWGFIVAGERREQEVRYQVEGTKCPCMIRPLCVLSCRSGSRFSLGLWFTSNPLAPHNAAAQMVWLPWTFSDWVQCGNFLYWAEHFTSEIHLSLILFLWGGIIIIHFTENKYELERFKIACRVDC